MVTCLTYLNIFITTILAADVKFKIFGLGWAQRYSIFNENSCNVYMDIEFMSRILWSAVSVFDTRAGPNVSLHPFFYSDVATVLALYRACLSGPNPTVVSTDWMSSCSLLIWDTYKYVHFCIFNTITLPLLYCHHSSTDLWKDYFSWYTEFLRPGFGHPVLSRNTRQGWLLCFHYRPTQTLREIQTTKLKNTTKCRSSELKILVQLWVEAQNRYFCSSQSQQRWTNLQRSLPKVDAESDCGPCIKQWAFPSICANTRKGLLLSRTGRHCREEC